MQCCDLPRKPVCAYEHIGVLTAPSRHRPSLHPGPSCFSHQLIPTPPGPHCFDFYPYRLILPVLKLHIWKHSIPNVLLCDICVTPRPQSSFFKKEIIAQSGRMGWMTHPDTFGTSGAWKSSRALGPRGETEVNTKKIIWHQNQ